MYSELFKRHNRLMRNSVSPYHRHRFPAEIISHCVWLYFRFSLSFRDVEEMLAMRGVTLSYETRMVPPLPLAGSGAALRL